MGLLKIQKQFGLWDSPITPLSLSRGIKFSDVAWDQDGTLVWLERHSERGVLVVQPDDRGAMRDLNSEYSVRARVGYGGGDFTVGHGNVFFVEANSGRIYRQSHKSGVARPVTPAFGHAASPVLSPDGRWLVFVHTYEGEDSLGIVDAEGTSWPRKLVSGNDFYMQPVWHPDGDRVAWIAWDHPNMPWDGTFLHLGSLNLDGDSLPGLENVATVTGGENASIFQPEFSPDGRALAYVSDVSGWWQIYLYDLDNGAHRQLTFAQAEHGLPGWVQGLRTYGFSPDGKHLYFLRNQESFDSLWQIDLDSGVEHRLALNEAYAGLGQIAVSPVNGTLALLASGGKQPPHVITYLRADSERVLRRGTSEELPLSAYSQPDPIQWAGLDGEKVYGLYYPPHNEHFEGIGSPPLIVHIHGGPTDQVRNVFNASAQFFTSRGYGFLEVNHRGSTGYGRSYRNMLRGNWGIHDVQDAVSGARHLVERGLVDGARLVIMGGSAGGFTVLKALEDFPGMFKAGICRYGVSNLFTLAAETHKFEARYNDTLLGPLPEAAHVYYERSPIFFVDKIQDTLAVFHGGEDTVVPVKQSDEVVASLRRRGVPHEYHVYPGEGHGFRKSETIEHFYKTAEKFLRQYVIFI